MEPEFRRIRIRHVKEQPHMEKILIIEDDELLNDGLCYHMQKNGYAPTPAYTLEQVGCRTQGADG